LIRGHFLSDIEKGERISGPGKEGSLEKRVGVASSSEMDRVRDAASA